MGPDEVLVDQRLSDGEALRAVVEHLAAAPAWADLAGPRCRRLAASLAAGG